MLSDIQKYKYNLNIPKKTQTEQELTFEKLWEHLKDKGVEGWEKLRNKMFEHSELL